VEIAEGEADAYIVTLAGKLGAYVIGNDSDFAVLHTEGYLVMSFLICNSIGLIVFQGIHSS
jgi:hypothetical protein